MYEQLVQNEATAALRRSTFQVTQSVDGKSALTGCTGPVRIAKRGIDTAASTASIVEISAGNFPGRYYIEFTAAELDTPGILEYRYKHVNGLEVKGECFVTPDSPWVAAPTTNDYADAILKRDWTAVTGEASRSLLNAVRFLRNRWRVAAGTLSVYKEDDTTVAWSGPLTGTPTVTEFDPV
jgi:hypothetical protein